MSCIWTLLFPTIVIPYRTNNSIHNNFQKLQGRLATSSNFFAYISFDMLFLIKICGCSLVCSVDSLVPYQIVLIQVPCQSLLAHKFGIPTFEMASMVAVFTNILSPSRASFLTWNSSLVNDVCWIYIPNHSFFADWHMINWKIVSLAVLFELNLECLVCEARILCNALAIEQCL